MTTQLIVAIEITVSLLLLGIIGVTLFRAQWLKKIRKKRSSYLRIAIPAISLGLILVLCLAALIFHWMDTEVRKNIGSQLETVNRSVNYTLHLWKEDIFEDTIHLAKDTEEFQHITQELLTLPRNKKELAASPAQSAVRGIIARHGYIQKCQNYSVIAQDLNNIASMREQDLGRKSFIALHAPKLLARAFAGNTVFIPPIHGDKDHNNDQRMFIATPITDQTGGVLAVLALEIDPNRLFTELTRVGKIGKTGETYAIALDGCMLGESRLFFELLPILQRVTGNTETKRIQIKNPGGNLLQGYIPKESPGSWPFSKMARAIQKHHDGLDVDGYRDYRGVRVLGVWTWLDEFQVGIATEIDEAEVLGAHNEMRLVLLGFLLGMALLAIILAGMLVKVSAKSQKQLQTQVEQRTAELNATNKELQTSRKKYQQLVDDIGDNFVIYSHDLEGKLFYVSNGITSLFGVSKEEVVGKSYGELFAWTQESLDASRREIERLLAGETELIHLEMEYTHPDGKQRILSINAHGVYDKNGTPTSIDGIAEDITARKEAERTIIEANEAKSNFLANMSHEIRTPMNAIIGMSYLALQTALTPKQFEYLSKIDISANALLSIINDILDFSKIEAGKLELESTSFLLEDVLDNIASLFSIKTREKGLEFLFHVAPDIPTALIGDPLRLSQILTNLAGNAIKFTNVGELVISVDAIEQNAGKVTLRFSVMDTGIGISKQEQNELFSAFSQADTSITRKHGGTGLGLTISKSLCKMLGGKIWVDSVPGEGSTFYFTAVFTIDPHGQRSLIPTQHIQGKRILIVDDNRTVRAIFSSMLSSMTFNVTEAECGEDSLAVIQQAEKANQPFDLVLVDWMLPGMDGITLSSTIRTLPLSMLPKIVMVSTYDQEQIIQETGQMELDGFLTKPVNRSTLFDTIMQVFGETTVGTVRKLSPIKQETTKMLQNICGAKILLVEDNRINQQVAREILEQAGMEVEIASDGKEAVERAAATGFDAILMDIQMPKMGGFEATDCIRNLTNHTTNTPIIAMTAHAMEGDREKSLAAGMVDHITKPINPDTLYKVLLQWIQPSAKNSTTITPLKDKNSQHHNPLPSIPGLDIQAALTRLIGNEPLYRELLVDFYTDYADTIPKIRAAFAVNDMERCVTLAHTIKGIAANLGAGRLQQAAAHVEQNIREENREQVEAKIYAMEKELNQLLADLQMFVEHEKGTDHSPKTKGSLASLHTLLTRLPEDLQTQQPKLCLATLSEIDKWSWPGKYEKELTTLRRYTKNYKFKEASELATELLGQLPKKQ